MSFRKNVVERLYVVSVKLNGTKYLFRVKAESEATAREKAKRDVKARFNSTENLEILDVDRIDPEDYV